MKSLSVAVIVFLFITAVAGARQFDNMRDCNNRKGAYVAGECWYDANTEEMHKAIARREMDR